MLRHRERAGRTMAQGQTKAQARCGARGHWQAMAADTGEVISKDCVYCGYIVDSKHRHGIDTATRVSLVVCAIVLIGYIVTGVAGTLLGGAL